MSHEIETDIPDTVEDTNRKPLDLGDVLLNPLTPPDVSVEPADRFPPREDDVVIPKEDPPPAEGGDSASDSETPSPDESEEPVTSIDDAKPNEEFIIPAPPVELTEEERVERSKTQLEAIREVFCLNPTSYSPEERKPLYERFRGLLSDLFIEIKEPELEVTIHKALNVVHHWQNIEKSKIIIANRPYFNGYRILLDHDWVNQPLFFNENQIKRYLHYIREEAFKFNLVIPLDLEKRIGLSKTNWAFVRKEIYDLLTLFQLNHCKSREVKTFILNFITPMLHHFELPDFGHNDLVKYLGELNRVKPYELRIITMYDGMLKILRTSTNIEEMVAVRNKLLDQPYAVVAEFVTTDIQERFLTITGISFMDIENQYPHQKYSLPFI